MVIYACCIECANRSGRRVSNCRIEWYFPPYVLSEAYN